MLYTIIPPEIIFGDDPETEFRQEKSVAEIEVKKGSVSIFCQPVGDEMKITRLISTNPQDYLKPEWQPGAVLKGY